MRTVLAGFFLLLVVFFSWAIARAAGAGEEEASALFRRAEADDARGAYAAALAEYEGAARELPSGAFVPRARARAATLRSHAEGDFAPFTRLEDVRRDPARSNDPAALAELLRDAQRFPPGLVRGEARMLVAEAYAGRLHRPKDAIPVLEDVISDPSADPLTARLALRMLVEVRLGEGDLDRAAATTRAHRELADPGLVATVATLVRRRSLPAAALALLGGTLFLATAAIARGEAARARVALARSWKIAAAFSAYVAIAGALLASGFEAGTATPFVAFGGALLPIVLLARAWSAAGSARAWARAVRAAACGLSVVCAAFLVLEWIDPAYLKSFGL